MNTTERPCAKISGYSWASMLPYAFERWMMGHGTPRQADRTTSWPKTLHIEIDKAEQLTNCKHIKKLYSSKWPCFLWGLSCAWCTITAFSPIHMQRPKQQASEWISSGSFNRWRCVFIRNWQHWTSWPFPFQKATRTSFWCIEQDVLPWWLYILVSPTQKPNGKRSSGRTSAFPPRNMGWKHRSQQISQIIYDLSNWMHSGCLVTIVWSQANANMTDINQIIWISISQEKQSWLIWQTWTLGRQQQKTWCQQALFPPFQTKGTESRSVTKTTPKSTTTAQVGQHLVESPLATTQTNES